jgi:hypothetical protein
MRRSSEKSMPSKLAKTVSIIVGAATVLALAVSFLQLEKSKEQEEISRLEQATHNAVLQTQVGIGQEQLRVEQTISALHAVPLVNGATATAVAEQQAFLQGTSAAVVIWQTDIRSTLDAIGSDNPISGFASTHRRK